MAKITKTPQQWREQLDEHTYSITREAATERPFTGQYYDFDQDGTYHCVCCGAALFLSNNKYDAGCGWPSFTQPVADQAVDEHLDTSHFMVRTEVVCHQCDAHLGHVFTDGPAENGLRYCINSASLDFVAKPESSDDS